MRKRRIITIAAIGAAGALAVGGRRRTDGEQCAREDRSKDSCTFHSVDPFSLGRARLRAPGGTPRLAENNRSPRYLPGPARKLYVSRRSRIAAAVRFDTPSFR